MLLKWQGGPVQLTGTLGGLIYYRLPLWILIIGAKCPECPLHAHAKLMAPTQQFATLPSVLGCSQQSQLTVPSDGLPAARTGDSYYMVTKHALLSASE